MIEKIEAVAAYVRVSSSDQVKHGLSLDAQKMKLKEYAEEHNLRIVEWYVDEGVSGTRLIKNRPELQRMAHDAKRGLFNRIIVIKLDRFFRSVSEYHEYMKLIAPVTWTATEEKYDASTANGRVFINMKLTIAEFEADQDGERVVIVNDYKVKNGQAITGSRPFCYAVGIVNGRKQFIKNPETKHIMEDAIQYYLLHQSMRGTQKYIQQKYDFHIRYPSLSNLFSNTLLYGEYRGNPNYCEPYMDKETFDKIQDIKKRNVKNSFEQKRIYIFTGIILCPVCGCRLAGSKQLNRTKYGDYEYKMYRCHKHRTLDKCNFGKAIYERTLERLVIEKVDDLLNGRCVVEPEVDEGILIPQITPEEVQLEIDRLNYAWQKGRIKSAEEYDKQYDALVEKLNEVQTKVIESKKHDYSQIKEQIGENWKGIYNALDDEHKRSFWRSFVQSIEISYETGKLEIARVNFF